MSIFFSYRSFIRSFRFYTVTSEPSRLHSERAMLDAIRRCDPFQAQS